MDVCHGRTDCMTTSNPPWTPFQRPYSTQGYAFVEFVERAEAEQAQLYLDGGQVKDSKALMHPHAQSSNRIR